MARPLVVRVPTRRDAQRRMFALVGSLAALQLVIDSLEPFLARGWMLAVRLLGATAAAGGAILFEMLKVRRAPS